MPTGTSGNPASSRAARTSVSCALYGVTTMRSRCCSGRAGTAASVDIDPRPPDAGRRRGATTAAASSAEEVALPECAIGSGVRPAGDAHEGAQRGDRMRVQLAVVRQVRHGLGDGRMHPPALGEEVAVLGRQHVVAVGDPAERRRVDRLGVVALAHLRQLLRVAEQQQVACGDARRDRGGERELAGLVDHEQVERPAGHAVGVREVPRGAADDEAGCRVLGRVLGDAVFRDDRVPVVARLAGVLRRLGDEVGIEPGADDRVEHVLDDGVGLRDDADAPPVLGRRAG